MNPLESAILKAEWAHEHLKMLDKNVRETLDPDGKGIVGNLDPDRSSYIFRREVSKSTVDAWRLTVGNIVCDLRTSLDHIAYQLALQTTKCPSDLARIEFPIFVKKPNESDLAKRTKHFKANAIEQVKRFQPYNGTDRSFYVNDAASGLPDTANPKAHVLWVIGKLAGIDKHRYITIVPMQAGFQGFNNRDNGDIRVRFDDAGIVAEVFGTFDPAEQLQPRVTLEPQVEIAEADHIIHYDFATLHKAYHLIADVVIPAFSDILPEPKKTS